MSLKFSNYITSFLINCDSQRPKETVSHMTCKRCYSSTSKSWFHLSHSIKTRRDGHIPWQLQSERSFNNSKGRIVQYWLTSLVTRGEVERISVSVTSVEYSVFETWRNFCYEGLIKLFVRTPRTGMSCSIRIN